jgi:hypothetical protein
MNRKPTNYAAPKKIWDELELSKNPGNPKTLLVTPFPSGKFNIYSKKVSGLTCLMEEASSLRDSNGQDRYLEQLYDDSDDVGLAIRFERTNEVAVYKLYQIKRNKSFPGEIASWEYLPSKDSVKKVPDCKRTKVIIFND